MCSHYSMSWHPFVFITPFPVSSVHQATPKLDLKGLTFRLPLSSSDYMNFLACVLHLAYSISPFPLPTLFSFFHCSQSPTLSSYFLPRPLLLALVVLTLVSLPPRKYTQPPGRPTGCVLPVRAQFRAVTRRNKTKTRLLAMAISSSGFGSLLG
jgi:hypothetical protein